MSKAHDNDAGWLFDLGGASALAVAVGFAVLKLGPTDFLPSEAAVAGSLAFLVAYAVLKRIDGEPAALPLTLFTAPEIEPEPEPEALLLDDALVSMGPDSRVVRMFDPDHVPTAGQLRAQIDRHVGGASDDAADALHQALADIRKALR